MSDYDVISFIHNKFHLLVNLGTVYSFLYSIEVNGLIEGLCNERKRLYKLTDKRKKTIETIPNANDKIKRFIISQKSTIHSLKFFQPKPFVYRNPKKPPLNFYENESPQKGPVAQ